jgi:hypothetical protein
MTDSIDMVEIVARAIFDTWAASDLSPSRMTWDEALTASKRPSEFPKIAKIIPICRAEARAAIEAYEAKLETTAADYEAATESHLKHVRDLDVAMNGEAGAAKQSLLIDIKGQLLDIIKANSLANNTDSTPKKKTP